jgi:hypothetical protein
MINTKDCKGIDLMAYVHAEGFLWAGHVVRIVENGISKRILHENLGKCLLESRGKAGKTNGERTLPDC